MIYIDDRAGSKELIIPLRKLGLEIESTRLEFADLMWEGRGLKGAAVSIGVEFKRLEELVQAFRTERLQGYQMKGMRLQYDYSYLMVQGELLYDAAGMLLKRKSKRRFQPMPGRMTVSELLKRVNVLHLCGGLNPQFTTCEKHSLQAISALYRCWTDVDLDKHKSHIAMYEAPPLVPISDFRRTVRTLPGIGMRASLAVEKYFGSLERAIRAGVKEWAAIEMIDDHGKTRRIGTPTATRIVAFCRGSSG